MISGLISGSKLWVYEKIQPVIEWLKPRLETVLENPTNENHHNWGIGISAIASECEPRIIGWLIEMLFNSIKKPCNNAFIVDW